MHLPSFQKLLLDKIENEKMKKWKNEKSRVERCDFEKYFNFTSRYMRYESKTRPVLD